MSAADHRQLHAIVEGMVQGVGFRNFVQDKALRLDITGWVRNTPDGSVEVTAEGPGPELDLFLQQLNIGPRMAKVSRVNVKWNEASGGLKGFRILYR